MRVFSWALLVLSMASVAAIFGGCAGKSVNESDPKAMYQDAEDEVKSDHYQLAIDKLKVVKNKFPYSKYSVDAELRLADIYFMQENYPEAAAAYESFRDLHPKHEKVPYAMFRTAKSYFNDNPGNVARDLTPAKKAEDAYNEFLKKFPNAPEAAEARKDLAEVRHELAKKELYIGNFYMHDDQFQSAEARFQKILTSYSDTDIAKEAAKRLAKAQEEIKKQEMQEKEESEKK